MEGGKEMLLLQWCKVNCRKPLDAADKLERGTGTER